MVDLGKVMKTWKAVFGRANYIVLAVLTALVFYFLNVLIVNWGNVVTISAVAGFPKTVWLLSLGFRGLVTGLTFWTVIILAVMTGILVSLLIAKTRLVQEGGGKKQGLLAGAGVFLGLLVPGCAACGVGLVALLGLTGALLALPFQGTEIAVVAVVLVGYAVLRVSEGFGSCKIR